MAATNYISEDELRRLVVKYFGDQGPDAVELMMAIARRESSLNAGANKNDDIEDSRGLFQINVRPNANPGYAGRDLYNAETNVATAREIYDAWGAAGKNPYGAWSTYGAAAGDVGNADAMTSLGRPDVSPADLRKADVKLSIAQLDAAIYGLVQNPPDPQSANYEFEKASYDLKFDNLVKLRGLYAEEDSGLYRLEDGTLISDQWIAEHPEMEGQVRTWIAQQNQKRDDDRNKIFNELGLEEWVQNRTGIESQNVVENSRFQNSLDEYREIFELAKADQNTVIQRINRQINGLAEARARATTTMEEIRAMAPWATQPGKTNFTAGDLAMPQQIAALAGYAPGEDVLKYTGTVHLDPNAIFHAYDEQLGVTGQLPEIPDLGVSRNQIPTPPALLNIPQGSPTFIKPGEAIHTPLPAIGGVGSPSSQQKAAEAQTAKAAESVIAFSNQMAARKAANDRALEALSVPVGSGGWGTRTSPTYSRPLSPVPQAPQPVSLLQLSPRPWGYRR